jgi:hypothetical protein
MTVRTNARVAGVTFLLYIAAGIGTLAAGGRAHVADVLTVITSLSALVLGVTLYAITRDVDADLARLALLCRVVESVPGHRGGPIFFAVGSTVFCWLLWRGRLIPSALALLGLAASALLVALLVLQRGGLFGAATQWSSSLTWVVWLPLLVFELTFAGWLIVKGVSQSTRRQTA